jgi:hypothetical protein
VTESERRTLRALVDQARRETITAQPICEFCGAEMEPHPKGSPKRFCSKSHRTQAFYRTERGKEVHRLATRRRRRRLGMAHRPGRELAADA